MSFTDFLQEGVVSAEVEPTQEQLDEAKKNKKSYTVKFEVSNDAFVEDFDGEVEFVLKQAIKYIQRGTVDKPLRDTNGNDVGSVK